MRVNYGVDGWNDLDVQEGELGKGWMDEEERGRCMKTCKQTKKMKGEDRDGECREPEKG